MEQIKQWLQSFPGWEGTVCVDYVDAKPGNTGLYPKGLKEIFRREDVLGNLTVHYRYDFLLRRNAARGEENAQWLMEFQNWVMEQSRLGLAPQFGDDPKTERIRASEGQLQSHAQAGSSMYTVRLSKEFTKTYRGE